MDTIMDEESSLENTANIMAERESSDQHITLDGKKVVLYKVKTRTLGIVLGLVNTSFQLLGIEKLGDALKINLEDPNVLLHLITEMHAPTIEAAAELSSLSYEEVNELDLDLFIELVLGLVKLNKSFFLERVLPTLEEKSKSL